MLSENFDQEKNKIVTQPDTENRERDSKSGAAEAEVR